MAVLQHIEKMFQLDTALFQDPSQCGSFDRSMGRDRKLQDLMIYMLLQSDVTTTLADHDPAIPL